METAERTTLDGFRKRDGSIVTFRRENIERAVRHAAEAVTRREGAVFNSTLPERVTDRVLAQLNDVRSEYYVSADDQDRRVPDIEDVQDLVEIVLAEQGCSSVVSAYKRYRKQRQVARRSIRVRGTGPGAHDVTDAGLLLVQSATGDLALPWDRARIVRHLSERAGLHPEAASNIAKAVENRIIEGGFNTVGTTLIREMVNNELDARGFREQLRDLSMYAVPRDYLDRLMFTKSDENSNIVNNNPEAVNLGIAELVLKQWALDTIFSVEVRRAHDTGAIHLHDLGYPHRVYCSSHSVEYVKKYGLSGLVNLNNESKPARSASVLTGHLNTFLASMQANYAGALGLAYINIFYAPLLEGCDDRTMKQVAQELIFNGAQNAFSRGGQTLFLDFNIHAGVPRGLARVPAIGPGGHYLLRRADGTIAPLDEEIRADTDAAGHRLMDLYVTDADGARRLVLREIADAADGLVHDPHVETEVAARGERVLRYGDYADEARRFAMALLEVWGDGDRRGRVFEFPKCDFHISEDTFTDPDEYAVFVRACELAARNGSTYFIFDRDEVTLSACCRLRTTIRDTYMLKHPETMRFCGFQNVTINMPQAAYRAARAGTRTETGLLEELDRTMDVAVEAHLQKKARVAEMMSGPGRPLHQIGRPANDGRPYVRLDECTYIIGLIGLNDAVKFLMGQELHESEEAMELGLRIVAHMNLRTRRLTKKHGLKLTLEESPAESAARRLAKSDLVYFAEEAAGIVRAQENDAAYYTNSVHLAPEAPVSLVERIRKQAMFHSMIESGAITHAFIGEEQPSAGAIAELIRLAFERTQAAQVTISPEFSYCDDCNEIMRGLRDRCLRCGSDRIEQETRVVGYFSKIHNWNKSKRHGELPARRQGRYAVTAAGPAGPPDAEDIEITETEACVLEGSAS
jgi:anaerobic ribonucleoside-triphosphate reductase